MKGLGHYKIDYDAKSINLVKRIKGDGIGLSGQFRYVVDVTLDFIADGIILVLDAELGLV